MKNLLKDEVGMALFIGYILGAVSILLITMIFEAFL